MGDKYYKFKHRIDFYLGENGVTDLSDYRLGHPAATGKVINIEHWNYSTVPKPTYKVLKELVKKPNFYNHMYENRLLPKLDFIIKVMFPAGDYKDSVVIHDKYKGLPYVWWVLLETGAFISDADLKSLDSQLVLYKTMNLYINRIVHIRCILTPRKDIDIDTANIIRVKPTSLEPSVGDTSIVPERQEEQNNKPQPKSPEIITTDSLDPTEEEVVNEPLIIPSVKERKLYEHPEITIPKTGSAIFKSPPRYDSKKRSPAAEGETRVKVTKDDINKIIK